MAAKRQKNHLWVPEHLFHLLCLPQTKPGSVWNISLPISRGVRWFLAVRDFIMLQGQECLPALGMMCALVWSMWTRAHGECHGSCPRAGARTAVLEGHPVNEVWLMCWVAPWQPPAVQGASREMHVACSCIRGVPHLPQAREGIAVLKESQLLINIAG